VTAQVAPIAALLAAEPDFYETLTPAQKVALTHMTRLWLRPEQHFPAHPWRYHGIIAGRGWGKTLAVACEIQRRVQRGEARHIGLMAPTDDRVIDVQLTTLIAVAPPWCRPERYRDGLRWPNGATAIGFTPLAPGRSRSENLDLSWLTELVDWNPSSRKEAFDNITTATRAGRRPQVLWDTTSKGRNDVIRHLLELHAEDPARYPIRRGVIFDNPLLSEDYLRAETRKYTGRRAAEELMGAAFLEDEGALFQQTWLDTHRVSAPPTSPEVTIIGVDPALSGDKTADEVGMYRISRGRDGHVYGEADLSGRMGPEEWGRIVVTECADRGAAGAIVERNHLGDNAVFVIRAAARDRGMTVETLTRPDQPMPRRRAGTIWVREVVAATSKGARASGPAAECQAGRVHLVGDQPTLEDQLTTYAPGSGRSPNRYDAFVYGVLELAGLLTGKAPRRAAERGADARAIQRVLTHGIRVSRPVGA
jgi:phage terminase large subunit-like protein